MINFFRKIRKQLADDNKPLQYMRYAIGEIALVVIGILIALSINNWNEERKLVIEEKDIYLSVSMMKKYEQLLSRDAIIVANMLNNDIREIISVDKDFDKVSEITRINPEDL